MLDGRRTGSRANNDEIGDPSHLTREKNAPPSASPSPPPLRRHHGVGVSTTIGVRGGMATLGCRRSSPQ